VIILSMAVGGGAVAAAYEARLSGQRDVLLGAFEQRLAIAKQQLALARQQLLEIESRVSVGLEPREAVLEMRAKVSEAEAELKSIELDIAEIRATEREPMHAVSAPLVSGRDFVTERWRIEMTVPVAALALERTRAEALRVRAEVGVADSTDVEAAMTRVAELEGAVETIERKLAIRQRFLNGGVSGPVADLRALEAETELRRAALSRRIELARRRVEHLQARSEVGTATPIELAEARLQLHRLELDTTKADYDLLLIRRQLAK
jgi:outer membrane protein TolC